MKTKLYILALLALFTCGLCLALPSVRHAAAELLTVAVFRISNSTAVINATSSVGPTAKVALAKTSSGLSKVTITPINSGENGERCTALSAAGLQLTIPTNDYTCKVRVSWSLAPMDRVADTVLIRTTGSDPTDVSPPSPDRTYVLPETGEILQEL